MEDDGPSAKKNKLCMSDDKENQSHSGGPGGSSEKTSGPLDSSVFTENGSGPLNPSIFTENGSDPLDPSVFTENGSSHNGDDLNGQYPKEN
ncbi:hypothetical protein AAVH_28794 [Aphelenchoides avenae]|nr:hypothetical protein AAVH_28794 [Aphelenchus avenae]